MIKSKTPVMGYAAREIEWLMAVYGMSFDHAVWEHPRFMTLVLMPVYAERQGHTGMMSYTDMASFSARQGVREWIENHFDIVDVPPQVVGWQLGTPPSFLLPRTQQAANPAVEPRKAPAAHVMPVKVTADPPPAHRTEDQGMDGSNKKADPGHHKHITPHNDHMQPSAKPDDGQAG